MGGAQANIEPLGIHSGHDRVLVVFGGNYINFPERASKKWKCAMVRGGNEAAQGGFARGGLASP